MKSQNVFLAIPTHDGRVGQGIVNAVAYAMMSRQMSTYSIEGGSSLTCNFNNLYCRALNDRTKGVTHFLMLHEDVWPQPQDWLTKMLGIMERESADILSVVMRLKSNDGMTSTAIEEPLPGSPLGFKARKLKLSEIPASTFTDSMLLVNTGLMLIDMQHDWADKLHFEFRDSIARSPEGIYYPVSLAEDYGMSRMARKIGLKVFATTEIEALHCGGGKFGNREV